MCAELVTTVVSTLKGDRDIAVGNLLGSSIYNILMILGVTTLVTPNGIKVDRFLGHTDIPLMVVATIACLPIFVSGSRITRLEGKLMVGAYFSYLAYLIIFRA